MKRGVGIVALAVVALLPIGQAALAKSSPWSHWDPEARIDLVTACAGVGATNSAAALGLPKAADFATSTVQYFQKVATDQKLSGAAKNRFKRLLKHLAALDTRDATNVCRDAGDANLAGAAVKGPTTTTSSSTTTTTSAPVVSQPPVGAQACPNAPSGNPYRPGEFCPHALFGETCIADGERITCTNNNGIRWEPA